MNSPTITRTAQTRQPLDFCVFLFVLICPYIKYADYNQTTYWIFNTLTGIVLILWALFNNRIKISNTDWKIIVTSLLFVGWVSLTGAFSIDPHFPLKKSIEILTITLFSIGLILNLQNKNLYIALLNANIVFGVIFSIYLYFHAGESLQINFDETVASKNVISFDLYASLIAIVIKDSLNRAKRVDWICFIIITIGLLITLSIKVYFAYSLLLLYIIIHHFQSGRLATFFFLLAIAGIFVFENPNGSLIQDTVGYKIVESKISMIFGYSPELELAIDEVDFRAGLIRDGIEIFEKNPIFGIGLENTRLILGTYTHNNVTELLAGTGIIGLLLFYLPLWWLVKACRGKNNVFGLMIFVLFGLSLIGHGGGLYSTPTYWLCFILIYFLGTNYNSLRLIKNTQIA